MVAHKSSLKHAPDRIERFYAEVRRDSALGRAAELRRSKDARGARQAAQEAAQWDQRVQQLLRLEQLSAARQRRDYFARIGIELAEAGDLPGARKAAREAERWDRQVKKLARL